MADLITDQEDTPLEDTPSATLPVNLLPQYDDIVGSNTRPFGPGEFITNPDGTWSNERTTTTDDNQVIPRLWLKDGVPTTVSEDEAGDLAKASGLKFPQFGSREEAEKFANDREANWQNIKPEDNAQVGSLWTATSEAPAFSPTLDSGKYDLPPVIPVQDQMVEARLHGYGWDEIHGFLDSATETAKNVWGYAQHEIDSYLGYQGVDALGDRLLTETQIAMADQANSEAKPGTGEPPDLPDATARAYANAMRSGTVNGPQDFADTYTTATMQALASSEFGVPDLTDNPGRKAAADAIAAQLPSNEEITDHAIALVHQSGQEVTPDAVRIAKDNLLSRWSDLGYTPQQSFKQAQEDPSLVDSLTSPRRAAVPPSNDPSLYQSANEIWDGSKWVDGPGMLGRIRDAIVAGAELPFDGMFKNAKGGDLTLEDFGFKPSDFYPTSPEEGLTSMTGDPVTPGLALTGSLKMLGYTAGSAATLAMQGIASVMMGGLAGGAQVFKEAADLAGLQTHEGTGGMVGGSDTGPHAPIVGGGTEYQHPDFGTSRSEYAPPVFDPVEFAAKAGEVLAVAMPELVPEVGVRLPKPPVDLFPHGIPSEIYKDPAMVEHLPDHIKQYFGLKEPEGVTEPKQSTLTITPEGQKALDSHLDDLAAQHVQEHFSGGLWDALKDLLWDEQGSVPRKMTFQEAYDAIAPDVRVDYDREETEIEKFHDRWNVSDDDPPAAEVTEHMARLERQKARLENRDHDPEGEPRAPVNASIEDQKNAFLKERELTPEEQKQMAQDLADERKQMRDQARHEENVASAPAVESRDFGPPRALTDQERYARLSPEDRAKVDALDTETQKLNTPTDPEAREEIVDPATAQRLREITDERDKLLGTKIEEVDVRDAARTKAAQEESERLRQAHEEQQNQTGKVNEAADSADQREAERSVREEARAEKDARSAADLEADDRAEVHRDNLNYAEKYDALTPESKAKIDELQTEHRTIREQVFQDAHDAMTNAEREEYDKLHAEQATLENKETRLYTQADSDRMAEIKKRTREILGDRVNLSEDQINRLRSIDDITRNLMGDAEPRPAASEFSARARAEAEAKAGAKESRAIGRDEKEREAIISKIEKAENIKATEAAFRAQELADAERGGRQQTGWLNRLMKSPWRTAQQRAAAFARRFYSTEIMADIRHARGMNKHQMDMARVRLQQYRVAIDPLIGEHRKWIREAHRDFDTAAKNPSRIQQLINHIEGVDDFRLKDTDPLFHAYPVDTQAYHC